MDLGTAPLRDVRRLYEYCIRVASAVGLICLEIFGYARSGVAAVRDRSRGRAAADEHPARRARRSRARPRLHLRWRTARASAVSEADSRREPRTPATACVRRRVKALLRHQASGRATTTARGAALPRATRAAWSPPRSWARSTARILDRIEARRLRRVHARRPRAPPAPRGRSPRRRGPRRLTRCRCRSGVTSLPGRHRHRRRLRRAERRRRAGRRGRACWCSTRGRSWAAGRRRSPIARPASSSTTAARALRLLSRDVRVPAADRRSGQRPDAAVARACRISIAPDADRCCGARALPSPLHLLAGVLDWDAMPLARSAGALRLGRPAPAARRRAAARPGRSSRRSAGRRCQQWLIVTRPERGRCASGCGSRWRSRRSISRRRGGAGAVRARAGRDVRAGSAAAALVLPLQPLHEMYAEPARALHRGARRRGPRQRARARRRRARTRRGVEVRGERIAARARHRRGALVRAAHAVRGDAGAAAPRSSLTRPHGMESKPIVTVNLWYDRPRDGRRVRRPARPGDAVGVRQAASVRRDARRTCRWSSSGADALAGA